MAIETRYVADANLTVIAHVGQVSDNEFITFYSSFFAAGGLEPTSHLLVDLRLADSSSRSPAMLRKLADFITCSPVHIPARTKVAVVAPQDLAYGLARMYGALADAVPWKFRVFRSVEDAESWLAVPPGLANDSDCSEVATAGLAPTTV
jgi:hypothetical protein